MALYILYYSVNLIACLFCSIQWYNERLGLRWQWVYLLLNLLSELVCRYMGSQGYDYTFLYHIIIPIEYGFLLMVLGPVVTNHRMRHWTYASGVAFAAVCLLNELWLDNFFVYSYDFLLRCGLVTVLVSYYFYELYHTEEITEPTRLPEFWISVGFLFFCLGTFFLMGLYALVRQADAPLAKQLYRVIMPILNVLLYSAYVAAALCNRKKYSYS